MGELGNDLRVWYICRFMGMIGDCVDYRRYGYGMVDEILGYDYVVDDGDVMFFKEIGKRINLLKMESVGEKFES